MMLPELYEGVKRSDKLLPVTLDMRITIKANCRALDIDLSIDNTARDHRLRMIYASGIKSGHFYTLNAFDLQRRPTARQNYSEYRETVSPVVPQLGITAICDKKSGLAVFSRGVHESEVSDDARGDIALTLLRCTGSEVPLRRADGGQMLGMRSYRFAVMPFGGEGELGSLVKEHEIYENRLEAVYVPIAAPAGRNLPIRDIAPKDSFITYESKRTTISAIKQCERGRAVIVRLFNPGEIPDFACLAFNQNFRRVRLCDLNEQPGEDVPYVKNSVSLRLEGKQIKSLYIEF
jgi:alpha-mannosidase/mannosylglycerate hydrolase